MQIEILNLANEMEIEILASMEEMEISRLEYLILRMKMKLNPLTELESGNW